MPKSKANGNMAMRWYQHKTQGAMPMTSPMNNAPPVADTASSQATKSSIEGRLIDTPLDNGSGRKRRARRNCV